MTKIKALITEYASSNLPDWLIVELIQDVEDTAVDFGKSLAVDPYCVKVSSIIAQHNFNDASIKLRYALEMIYDN